MAKILVYGGCVSRDTFETMKNLHDLSYYVARQSLVSAAAKPSTLLSTVGLKDDFQSRCVKGDMESSLFKHIRNRGKSSDVFIFDILSERLGYLILEDRSVITYSNELNKSGILRDYSGKKKLVRFGTDVHFAAWAKAAQKLKDQLLDVGLFGRALAIEAPWTDETDNGEIPPRFRALSAEGANQLYLRYYAKLRMLGFATIKIPVQYAVSTGSHKWGAAQYHYVDEAYHWLRDTIQSRIDDFDILN